MSNSQKKSRRDFLMMAGVALAGATGVAKAAENAFGVQKMEGGYEQVAMMEGKCGEGKCGGKMKDQGMEGKCGGKMKKSMEGKCGEGKCGGKMKGQGMEGKCGGKMKKSMEGKCGEGKCGGKM